MTENDTNKLLALNYRATDVIAKFNGQEMELHGDFGNFIFLTEQGQTVFESYKIQFKFYSEHRIEGVRYDGEM